MTTQQEEPDSSAEKVERILLEARLLHRRGQGEEAVARCQEALDVDPKSWEAHELAGDILLEQGRAADALERFRAAHAIVPEQASVEEKMARATLAQAERDWLREGVEPGGAEEPVGPPRNPGIAALLSLVLPGLGQGYNRQALKGAVILGVVLVLWVIVIFQMVASLGGLEQVGGTAARVDVMQALFAAGNLVWLALIVLVWFYSIVDAALIAGRPAGERRDII